ncbi:MAG: ferritin [Bacteroidales bacterium]|nr:ferritin [Bacteroidales bacterium]MBQ7984264.1 ferritin [Bacteroidales bacterium]
MLSKKVEKALNKQINAEFWSAYLYLSMASCLDSKGFTGMSSWMRKQFAEEQEHATKLFDYVLDKGGRVLLEPIAKVETEWKDALDVFNATLKHEQKVTSMINDLCALAIAEKDYATESFLHWFVDEQVEEEKNAREIIDVLKLIGKDGYGLYRFDKELAARK